MSHPLGCVTGRGRFEKSLAPSPALSVQRVADTSGNFGNPAAGAYKPAAERVGGGDEESFPPSGEGLFYSVQARGDEEVSHLRVKACLTSSECVFTASGRRRVLQLQRVSADVFPAKFSY